MKLDRMSDKQLADFLNQTKYAISHYTSMERVYRLNKEASMEDLEEIIQVMKQRKESK